MSIKRDYRSFDITLVILVCVLAVFGIIIIGSATQTSSRIYTNQRIWFVTGLALMTAAAFIDYHYIAKFYIIIYSLNLAMLIFVLVFPSDTKDVSRWIGIGSFTIQPSEFAKIFMIIFLAKYIDKKNETINNISQLGILFLSILAPTILIVVQPALSATMVLLVLSFAILFASSISYKFFAGAAVLFGPPIGFCLYDLSRDTPLIIDRVIDKLIEMNIFKDYWLDRMMPFLNPGVAAESEQTSKSISAIGSGMLTGRGLGQGPINKYNYLAENHNDFIFAVIGEELGFIGSAAVLIVIFIVIVKCLFIARNATDELGKLIAVGVAAMLAFQVFDNVGVATGIMPNTGMPFPFISSGGTAMWVSMIGIGLVLNVSMSKPKSIFEG